MMRAEPQRDMACHRPSIHGLGWMLAWGDVVGEGCVWPLKVLSARDRERLVVHVLVDEVEDPVGEALGHGRVDHTARPIRLEEDLSQGGIN